MSFYYLYCFHNVLQHYSFIYGVNHGRVEVEGSSYPQNTVSPHTESRGGDRKHLPVHMELEINMKVFLKEIEPRFIDVGGA